MTLEDLMRRFRVLADDRVEPYLFDYEDVLDWLNDAQDEAALRGRLLLEDALPAVCQIPVVIGTFSYPLHPKLYELVRLRFKPDNGQPAVRLHLASREWLDANVRDWRDQVGDVRYAVQGETGLRVVGIPDEPGMLLVEGYRLPLEPMEDEDQEPEIHDAHHRHLIQWALHQAYGRPDAETFDPKRSELAEQQFTAYFGARPDVGLRRMTREDAQQHNRAF